jgi:hypothetical protein
MMDQYWSAFYFKNIRYEVVSPKQNNEAFFLKIYGIQHAGEGEILSLMGSYASQQIAFSLSIFGS